MLAEARRASCPNPAEGQALLRSASLQAARMAWTAYWRPRLDTGVSPKVLFAEMRRLGQPAPAVREWTVDQDTVAHDVELKKSLENRVRATPFAPPAIVP